ncbi:MAG: hypothetical protein ACRYFK_16670 [Janthinobacterium lividum]
MANTLDSFIAYFRRLSEEHLLLKGSCVHGASGRIISGSRNGLRYPLLWLETPSLALNSKDGTAPYGERNSAFIILASASTTDYAAQDAAWVQTEAIALDVLSYLWRDKKARKINFDLSERPLEAVATLTVAGEIGWRYEFALGDYVPITFDATRWKEQVQP